MAAPQASSTRRTLSLRTVVARAESTWPAVPTIKIEALCAGANKGATNRRRPCGPSRTASWRRRPGSRCPSSRVHRDGRPARRRREPCAVEKQQLVPEVEVYAQGVLFRSDELALSATYLRASRTRRPARGGRGRPRVARVRSPCRPSRGDGRQTRAAPTAGNRL